MPHGAPGSTPGTVYYGKMDGNRTIAVLLDRVSPMEYRLVIPCDNRHEQSFLAKARDGEATLVCRVVSRGNLGGLTHNPRGNAAYRTWAPAGAEVSPEWLPDITTVTHEVGRMALAIGRMALAEGAPAGARARSRSRSRGPGPSQAAVHTTDQWSASLKWFDDIQYAEAFAEKVVTVEYIPHTVAVAVADARCRVLQAIVAADRDGIDESRCWKLLTFFDRLIFCTRKGGHRTRRGGAKHKSYKGNSWNRAIARRLHFFDCGDWDALWREAEPTEKPQDGQTARSLEQIAKRVEKLTINGELSKAVAAATQDFSPVATHADYVALTKLFPEKSRTMEHEEEDMASIHTTSDATRERIREKVWDVINQYPHLSCPGPSGSRFEHWGNLKHSVAGMKAAAIVLTRFILGEVPEEALRANLGATILALPKLDGGVRPIACGSVIRRLAARAVCKALKDELVASCSELQYAVGVPAGAEKLQKTLTTLAEMQPNAVFLKLDFRNAFNTVSRSEVTAAVRAHCPQLSEISETLCGKDSHHWWYGADDIARRITSECGVDQGCPLSPALFALTIRDALITLRTRLRAEDEKAFVLSYLDDIYICINADKVSLAVEQAKHLFSPLGLELNTTKTRAWSPNGTATIPGDLQQVSSFTCLGAAALWVPKDCVRVDVAARTETSGSLRHSIVAMQNFSTKLGTLRQAGLSLHCALAVHRAWVNGSITHHLRANLADVDATREWDTIVAEFYARELDRPLDDTMKIQLALPLKMGGCGIASAETTRLPAYLGAWEQSLSAVGKTLGANSAAQLHDSASTTRETIAVAAVELRAMGIPDYAFDWEEVFSEPRKRRQRELTKQLQTTRRDELLVRLPLQDQADFRSGGGVGAGAFLDTPTTNLKLPDDRMRVALRARLRMARPGFDISLESSVHATHCQHANTNSGVFCGLPLDQHDPARCAVGGAFVRGHNQLRDFLARWVGEQTGQPTAIEQLVTPWHRRLPSGEFEMAKLDVSCMIGITRTHIDVAYTNARTEQANERNHRAKEDGRAAAQKVLQKRTRYPPAANPGESLVPFVIEALGRPSTEAVALLRALASSDPIERSTQLSEAWREVSVITQTRLAELYLSAERPRPPR